MNNEIEKMQEFIKRNVRGCLPMIESAFIENNCICGNCVECKALLLASSDIARNLYNAGYRKQSDTVKEFAERVLKEINDAINHNARIMESSSDTNLATYHNALITNNACKGIYDVVTVIAKEFEVEE
ncbi:MAG TPA: hypothetical protein VFD25_05585 [Clostridia bacterium]|nr:hypothetical protein [Clostridia bacterium]